jgi:drug/metabolite transporter (DMT)-like permease
METCSFDRHLFVRVKGIFMALIGASLWGLSGTVAQMLFQHEGFRPEWLVTVRMIFSGILLLIISSIGKQRNQVWSVWKHSKDRLRLILFGIVGMLGVQYTFFAAIQTGNAATATLLQYLGPVFITLFLAVRFGRLPSVQEFLALLLALLGTFFLITNGSVSKLSVSAATVAWGLGSAITAAFYTLYPSELLKRWGAMVIVGWGMVIGGSGLALVNPPWVYHGQHWSLITALFVGFVIVFGTLIPFYLYMDSMRFISPTEASLLGSAEPLSAVILSVIWLNVPFGLFEAIGGLCIVATVTLLSLQAKTKKESERTISRHTVEG